MVVKKSGGGKETGVDPFLDHFHESLQWGLAAATDHSAAPRAASQSYFFAAIKGRAKM